MKTACGKSESPADLLNVLGQARGVALKGGLYGAAAGSVQVLSLMWLRTIINFQYRHGVGFVAAVAALHADGGWWRFYRGLPYALLQNPLSKFGSVAAYEGSRVIIPNHPLCASILSVVLTIIWKVCLMPLESIKTILQVDGSAGTTATMLSTLASHYPWYLVHNLLDHMLAPPSSRRSSLQDEGESIGIEWTVLRSAWIGLVATAVSDIVANALRVIKTVKQSLSASMDPIDRQLSYEAVVSRVVAQGGWAALLGRGLATRMAANAVQGVLFTIVWKLLPLYVRRWRRRRPSSVGQAQKG